MLDFTDGSIANGIIQPACILESKLLAASGVSAQPARGSKAQHCAMFISSLFRE